MTETAVTAPKVLVVDDDYPILPRDINLGSQAQIREVFGRQETEVEASLVIKLCQERKSWEPFTLAEFNDHWTRGPRLEDLKYHGRPLLVRLDDGTYGVTHELIARVFIDYPAESFSDIDEV